ncbi:MAG: site-2 protease family protein [Halorientalis sp.]
MRSYTVTRVWGIPIRINISLVVFLPVLAWLIGSGAQIAAYTAIVNGLGPVTLDPARLQVGTTPWVVGAVAALGLFVSVVLHELGHAWAAMRYGLGVQSITLWILGGIASLDAMPREWNRELWIALAGPAVSLLVALACLGALQVLPASLPAVVFVVGWLAVTNLVLTAFNLLPAFPMDGGRVFRALLARSRSYEDATRTAARVGTGFAVLFALVGVLSFAPLLLLLALFVYGAATTESRTVLLQELLAGLTVGDVAGRDVQTVDADTSVAAFAERLLRDRRTAYPVVEDGETVGAVTLADVRDVPADEREMVTVGDIAQTDVPRLDRALGAFDGLVALNEQRGDVALLTAEDRVVGVVSSEDFSAVLQFRGDARSAGVRGAL